MEALKTCETCLYFYYEYETNYYECTSPTIEEDELDEYFVENEPGCPHYCACPPERGEES